MDAKLSVVNGETSCAAYRHSLTGGRENIDREQEKQLCLIVIDLNLKPD
jgi:hypothetical protein